MLSSRLSQILKNKKVLITAGPTREYLDSVRFFSNASSGKMALSLAESFKKQGAKVFVVCGPGVYPGSAMPHCNVTTASEMFREVKRRFPSADLFISAAAVCDYRPKVRALRKIPKSGSELRVQLVRNPDILAEMSRIKKRQLCVGFALEDRNPLNNALAKLRAKKCDLVVLNGPSAMESDFTLPTLVFPSGKTQKLGRITKKQCAEKICRTVAEILCNQNF